MITSHVYMDDLGQLALITYSPLETTIEFFNRGIGKTETVILCEIQVLSIINKAIFLGSL